MFIYTQEIYKSSSSYRFITHNPPFFHTHEFWEIVVFFKGNSINSTSGQHSITCPPRTCLIMRPYKDSHKIEHSVDALNSHLDIYTTNEEMVKLCSLFSFNNQISLYDALMNQETPPVFTLSENLCNHILDISQTIIPLSREESSNIHTVLVVSILSAWISYRMYPQTLPDWISNFIKDLKTPENFQMPLTQLMENIPYSRTYINNKFKYYTQYTPSEFFINEKILYAANLLRQTNHTISLISEMLGYVSNKNFINAFKQKIGLTPAQYRKQTVKKAPPPEKFSF